MLLSPEENYALLVALMNYSERDFYNLIRGIPAFVRLCQEEYDDLEDDQQEAFDHVVAELRYMLNCTAQSPTSTTTTLKSAAVSSKPRKKRAKGK